MTTLCPNCGAEITFRSIGLSVIVCDFCRSTILRSGDVLSIMGTAATVPDTISPLQIGTTGVHNGASFELIGRVRWSWSEGEQIMGGWTEWLALFADGSHGWLAEAMGRYMLTRRIDAVGDPILKAVAWGEPLTPGDGADLAGSSYAITDARPATVVGSDGELPFAAPKGETVFSVDMIDGAGGCASVQKHGDNVSAYVGRYVALSDLQLRNLRKIEGWPPPAWAAA
ncbi:hypothetical protein GCM10011529_28330 [Polymorphobacter glacialis]|uniref:DUF4178 domain-containing protein n=1 Tax=Sandarakinorhabdus glacialis TaxID=1614636 RepID=A0A917A0J2_9SPHN|nr:DUF4178 domain-containing protein [Polymorphobacter glacialis]GGE20053.1 hypothetical protein GCM10011529_28330 [Polymorphobacter glacialis]